MSELLFVGGDLSGIQKFIYNISSKKAMVSLKGRSAYLSIYSNDVCNKILNIPEVKASELSEIIYCSGGKFYLQVPNTDNIRTAINKLREEISEDLWDKHNGQLSINISYVPFDYTSTEKEQVVMDNGEIHNIGILWKKLTEDFNQLKNQKFKHLLAKDYKTFFNVTKVAESTRVCAITGIESDKCVKLEKDDNGNELYVLPSVKEQIELGKKLRDKDHFKMLEEYAKDSYLGILRMDVDGLGKVFIEGFPSMKEYQAFSKKLDVFFDSNKGNLSQIKQQDQYKEDLNIVYAGGDDIFAVGRWNKIIDFAAEIRKQFKDYIKRSDMSISGGVAVVGAKFPIAKAAELAGEAEDMAKSYLYNGSKKNAFCFLGETVSWENEFDYVLKYKEQFVRMINEYGLSRSLLHKIMNYANIAKENKIIEEENKNGNYKRKPNLSYIWHTVYCLTRYIKEKETNSEVINFCKDLKDKQLTKHENFRLMSLAARWAELELREHQNNNINIE